MTPFDVILSIFSLLLILLIANQIRQSGKRDPIIRKWFMKGLWAKLIGGYAFALVYTYYYEYGGDTMSYYHDTRVLLNLLFDSPADFFSVFFHYKQNLSSTALDYLNQLHFMHSQEYILVNTAFFFVLIGIGSYYSGTLWIAFFTYWGVWKLFRLALRYYPEAEKQMAFAILFIPSVFFWGSGLNKDSFIFCALGLFLYNFDRISKGGFWRLNSLSVIAISSYFMFSVKPYVIVSIVPAALIWKTLYLRDRIKSGFIRAITLPVLGVFAVILVSFSLDFLGQYTARYSVEGFMNTAQDMQNWHYKEGENTSDQHGRGSSYSLGNYDDSSWLGLLQVFPAAVNVTFFRPYLWEVNGIAMLAQAIESLLFLIFTAFTILKVGPIKVYRFISNDSFLLMCVVFAIFFGFAVGFSSYNFGALSRYKIPCIPFYAATLFLIRYKYLVSKRFGMQGRKHYNSFSKKVVTVS